MRSHDPLNPIVLACPKQGCSMIRLTPCSGMCALDGERKRHKSSRDEHAEGEK